jgi:hypothetical protein
MVGPDHPEGGQHEPSRQHRNPDHHSPRVGLGVELLDIGCYRIRDTKDKRRTSKKVLGS